MRIIKLIGLLLFATLLFIGRFGISTVASEAVVINPVTDQPVSRLIVQQSPAPLRMKERLDQTLVIQPVNHLEILTGTQPVRQNLARLQQAETPQQTPNSTCASLQTIVTDMFGRSVTKAETPFTDEALGMTGLDCQLTVMRASSAPEDYLTIAQDLKTSLEAAGWREDKTYIAYGPSEVTLALQQDNNSGMLTVGRQAINSTACRGTRSVTICLEGTNQQRYQITFSFTVAPLPTDEGITIIRGTSDYQK